MMEKYGYTPEEELGELPKKKPPINKSTKAKAVMTKKQTEEPKKDVHAQHT